MIPLDIIKGTCSSCRFWSCQGGHDWRCFNPNRIPVDEKTGAPMLPLVTGKYFGCDDWEKARWVK